MQTKHYMSRKTAERTHIRSTAKTFKGECALKKNKKLISLLMSSLLLLTGCGSSASENNANNPKPTTPPTAEAGDDINVETNIQIPQRIDGVITLSLGYSTSSADPRGVASEQFKAEVDEKTGGTVRIALYPNSEKGNDNELITKVTTGEIDMTVSSAGNFTGYVNEVGISALPFLFENFEQAWKFMDSDVVKKINLKLEDFNIHVLAHFDNGFRCVTTKNKPINTPDDMADLNIRTPDNAVVKETMSALGALPQTLGFSELYDALKNGTFDAQENPIPIIYNNKFYEVQKYLAITNHSYDAMPFVISKEAWNALTANEQEVIQTAATNAQATNRQLNKQQTEDYITKLEHDCGMTITYPDLSAFKAKTESVKTFFNYDQKLLDSVTSIIE